MLEAGAWGLLAASSLIIGAALVMFRRPSKRLLGLIMGFGAGVLLSAVSFELVEEAADTSDSLAGVGPGLFVGSLVFFTGDTMIARYATGGAHKIDASRAEGSAALSIVLGTVLDGVPESAVLGLTLLQSGEIGVAMLVAVFVSNMPEAIAASADLLEDGWSKARVMLLWTSVALVSALAAALGYGLLEDAAPSTVAFMFAFAAGAILTMLSTSMMPEAYELTGRTVGLAVTFGFAVAFAITWFGD